MSQAFDAHKDLSDRRELVSSTLKTEGDVLMGLAEALDLMGLQSLASSARFSAKSIIGVLHENDSISLDSIKLRQSTKKSAHIGTIASLLRPSH